VLAVGLVGVLAVLLVAGLLVAAVATTGQRVRTAADLAALAAAGRALEGADRSGACAAGGRVAVQNGASLLSCTVSPTETGIPRVELEVGRPVDGTPWTVRARAAAGAVPAEEGWWG
jgi:secretion/DNA translocation related TadE-like protein